MSMLLTEKQNAVRQKIEVSPNVFVVLIDVSGRKDIPVSESNMNIFCVDEFYNILWEIKLNESDNRRDSFAAIFYENDVLKARRFFGREYELNLTSGEAKEIGWDK